MKWATRAAAEGAQVQAVEGEGVVCGGVGEGAGLGDGGGELRRGGEEGLEGRVGGDEGLFGGGDGGEVDLVEEQVAVVLWGGEEAQGAGVGAGAEGDDLARLVGAGGREEAVDEGVDGGGAGVGAAVDDGQAAGRGPLDEEAGVGVLQVAQVDGAKARDGGVGVGALDGGVVARAVLVVLGPGKAAPVWV